MSENSFCIDCETPKPSRTFHCNIANKCVLKYELTCYQANISIGVSNILTYLLFKIILATYFLFTMIYIENTRFFRIFTYFMLYLTIRDVLI